MVDITARRASNCPGTVKTTSYPGGGPGITVRLSSSISQAGATTSPFRPSSSPPVTCTRVCGAKPAGRSAAAGERRPRSRTGPVRHHAAGRKRRTAADAARHPGARLAEYLRLIRNGQHADWDQRRLDSIPTVSVNGDVVLLSPELADTTAPAYGYFLAGNILHRPLPELLYQADQLSYVRDFLTGLNTCRTECPFFDYCRGAQAANRYFENGSLATTQTHYCRVSRQALITALPRHTGNGACRMTLLDQLATSEASVVMDLITPPGATPPFTTGAAWDNRPTWDNWNKKR
jgi:hypothetical protein